jgi:hypothetical protein
MKSNQKVEETDSPNLPNCDPHGNDLLVKDQNIKPAKVLTWSQLIMQFSSKNLFIEEEKYKALLVSQRIL